MKRYGWALALLLMTLILAAPYPAAACGGGQMDHSMMMGSGNMGSSGTMGSGTVGSGQMGGSGQMSPDNMGNPGYANPNAMAPGQPAGTWTSAPSGQMTGNPNQDGHQSGHDHNH